MGWKSTTKSSLWIMSIPMMKNGPRKHYVHTAEQTRHCCWIERNQYTPVQNVSVFKEKFLKIRNKALFNFDYLPIPRRFLSNTAARNTTAIKQIKIQTCQRHTTCKKKLACLSWPTERPVTLRPIKITPKSKQHETIELLPCLKSYSHKTVMTAYQR